MKLEPRQLAHLATIAECGSFGRAAVRLNISQPALSASIAQLERTVGGRVLERGRHGAKLTELGHALARHSHAVSSQLSIAAEEIRLRKLGGYGPLKIGVTPISAASLVPEALGRLKRTIPKLSASVIEGVFGEGMSMLRAGEIDLFVGPVGIFPISAEIVEQPLTTDPLDLVLRPRHPLASSATVSLRDLRDADWALPSEGGAFQRQIEALFISAGVQWPAFYIGTNSMTALRAIVMQSDCVTIMPRRLLQLERKAKRLTTVPLKDRGSRRSLGLSWIRHRGLSPIAARFADCMLEVARKERVA
jgi:LysR family transcriptional regulator, regulator for genes of the gallate degradation pathway